MVNYFRSWAQREVSISATCSVWKFRKCFHFFPEIIQIAEYVKKTVFVFEHSLRDWPECPTICATTPLPLAPMSGLAAITSPPDLISHRAVNGDQDEPGRVGPPWKLPAAARLPPSTEPGNDAGLAHLKWEREKNKPPFSFAETAPNFVGSLNQGETQGRCFLFIWGGEGWKLSALWTSNFKWPGQQPFPLLQSDTVSRKGS